VAHLKSKGIRHVAHIIAFIHVSTYEIYPLKPEHTGSGRPRDTPHFSLRCMLCDAYGACRSIMLKAAMVFTPLARAFARPPLHIAMHSVSTDTGRGIDAHESKQLRFHNMDKTSKWGMIRRRSITPTITQKVHTTALTQQPHRLELGC
jgi:hypothetical protein